MKKINIIKIYDASNAHEAEHLIGKLVIYGHTMDTIYCGQDKAILGDIDAYEGEFDLLLAPKEESQNFPTYIAEFEEVEDGK